MWAREVSGSWMTVRNASAIAASSALRLLHTFPPGTVHSIVRFSWWSSIRAPPPPHVVPAFADPSEKIVQSRSGWRAIASRAAALRLSGGSVLFVSLGRFMTMDTSSPVSFHGGSPWKSASGSTGSPSSPASRLIHWLVLLRFGLCGCVASSSGGCGGGSPSSLAAATARFHASWEAAASLPAVRAPQVMRG